MPLSSLPFLNFSEELPETVRRELEQYTAKLRRYLLVSLNEDGTLRTTINNSGDLPLSPGGPASFVRVENTITPGGNSDEQWWKKGPWTLDDPNAQLDNVVALRPVAPPAGSYNDYAPPGIDAAVVLELSPSGNITLTGIQKAPATRKRMLMLRNSSPTYTITLTNASTASNVGNRFSLPAATSVVLDPGQNIWLYYDLLAAAWTAAITTQKAGGFNVGGAGGGDVVGPAGATNNDIAVFDGTTGKLIKDGGATIASLITKTQTTIGFYLATVTLTDAQLKLLNTTPVSLIAAPGGTIVPLWYHLRGAFSDDGSTVVNATLRWKDAALTTAFAATTLFSGIGPVARKRSTMVTAATFNLLTTTIDLAGVGIEVIGSANAGAGLVSTTPFTYTIAYYIA